MKATHTGTCQACGREQKCPKGVIAKHGYTVLGRGNGGFFNGTCKGSGHAPLEVSCDLAAECADGARRYAASLEEQATREGADSPDGIGWRREYVRGAHVMGRWVEGHHTWNKVDYKSLDSQTLRRAGEFGSPVELATTGNRKYADTLRARAADTIAYAETQENIVKNWKPGTLKPVQ